MYTIEEVYTFEQIIKRSKFIGHLAPVTTVEEANAFLKTIRKTYYDATHNCYSYIIGKNGEYYKNSDDGEPSQTAGVVIYDALNKNNLTNVICIITRYFGGIKLGAGGLVRAYGSTTSETIKNANLIEIINYQAINITFEYSYANEIFALLDKYESINKTFTDKITCQYLIPESEIDDIANYLINLTKNTIIMHISNPN